MLDWCGMCTGGLLGRVAKWLGRHCAAQPLRGVRLRLSCVQVSPVPCVMLHASKAPKGLTVLNAHLCKGALSTGVMLSLIHI